jgi:carboxyl-terminal processing protease
MKNISWIFLLASLNTYSMSIDKQDEIKWAPTNMSPMFILNTIKFDYCNYSIERFKGCVALVDRFIKYNDSKFSLEIENGEFKIVNDNNFDNRFIDYKKFIIYKREKLDRFAKFKSDTLLKSLVSLFDVQVKIKGTIKPHEVAIPINEFEAIFSDPFKRYEPLPKYNGLNHFSLPASMGAELSILNKKISVDRVVVNSPSFEAGLKPDDQIIQINGKDITVESQDDLDKIFKFENQEKVLFKIKRAEKVFDMSITFTYSSFPPVVDKVINFNKKKYTYLHLNEIPSDLDPDVTCRIFQKILKNFNENTEGLILDLRDNVGGYGDVAACIASSFIGEDKILFTEKSLDGETVEQKVSDLPKMFNKPVVTIVNQGTASSGEILAGILQFYGRSYIVGSRTFGKGIGQISESYPTDNSMINKIELHFTSLMIQYANGESHQGKGIIPDYQVFYHGLTESLKEKNALRMEDYAVYPLKFPNGKNELDKITLPKLPEKCSDIKKIEEMFNQKNDFEWDKDMQLQFSISLLNCL